LSGDKISSAIVAASGALGVLGSLGSLGTSFTPLVLPANSDNYIYINELGTLTYGTSEPDTEENLLLGRAITDNTSVIYTEQTPLYSHHMGNQISKTLRHAFGPVFVSGSLTQEVGTRQLQVTEGHYHFGELVFYPAGANHITFDTYHKSAVAGVYTRTVGQTTVSNSQYDNGTGTLASIPAGKFTKHVLVLVGSAPEKYALVYGTELFDTLTETQNSPLANLPNFMRDSFVKIASIIVKQGETSIQDIIDERPRVGFASSSSVGGLSSHSELSNLGADDHLQYLRTDGSRALTGNLNLNSNNITNVGNINGINIASHASRHLPNGADPLTTGVPSSVGSANSTGVANAFSRQDHVHAHGNQGRGSQHQDVTITESGFMSATDKVFLDKAANFSINDGYGITGGGNLQAPITLNVGLNSANAFNVTTSIQTTSTSYTASDISLTLAEGTWMVTYSAVVSATSNSRIIKTALYLDTSIVDGTQSQYRVGAGAGLLGGLLGSSADQGNNNSSGIVTVIGGSQTLSLRWSTSGGTGIMQQRQITAIRIA
jgi:hypothetical protein